MRRSVVACVVLSLVLGLAVTAPRGQDGPVNSLLVERDEVRFITLDVVIEEKVRRRWQAADGLDRSRVNVWVGGALVELDQFERFCGPGDVPPVDEAGPGRTATLDGDSAASDEPSLPPGPPAAGSPTQAGDVPARAQPAGPGPVRYVLFFDLTHLKLGGYNASFRAAERWAKDTIQPEDEVMIVTGADALRIVRPLSPAGGGILEDLELAREDYLRTDVWAEWEGDANRGRIREIMEQPALPKMPGKPPEKSLGVNYARLDLHRTRHSLQNLTDLMTLFEEVEGTKNLVLFQETIRYFPGSAYPSTGPLSDVEVFLDGLARAANERNVRIYPVDAAGLRIRGGIDDAMTMLASETGGRWLEGSNDLSLVFEQVAEDAACFFRFGFSVRPRFSGRTETIRVTVDGDTHYRVRHRRTLYDATREERERDRLRAAFLHPSGATVLPVSLDTASLLPGESSERVRLRLSVPLKSLLALPAGTPGEEYREIQVQMGATILRLREPEERGVGGIAGAVWADAAPESPPWEFARRGSLRLPFEGELGEDRNVILSEELLIPPGDYRVVAVAQDRLAATLGATVADFRVHADVPALTEILLLQASDGDVVLERSAQEKSLEEGPPVRRDRRRSSIRAVTPVLPAKAAAVSGRPVQAGHAAQISYGLCTEQPDGGFDGWRLTRTLACEGDEGPGDLPERALPPPLPGSRCALVSELLMAPDMSPGDCTFSVRLTRPGAGDETRSLGFHVLDR